MNKTWIVVGLFAVAAAIAFQAWWPSYAEAQRLKSQHDDSCQFRIDETVVTSLVAGLENQNSVMWAHCDPASTYPRKDPDKCNVSHIEIGVNDE